MKSKKITIWQNKIEEIISYSGGGESRTFASAHELIQFLQDKTLRTTITIMVEQV